ncbi:MAG: hypothetical protein ABSB49_10005 [Polyangia bacterium]|jgi:hypothetical protein
MDAPAGNALRASPIAPAPVTSSPLVPSLSSGEEAPLQFKIGRAFITPVGFMDFTGVWRSTDVGSGIGTNFGSIPYGAGYGTNLSETRLSMQNSRIGFRVDAPVGQSKVMGYMEADFLGNNGGNVAVSSNSNTLRSRLYWVDVNSGDWEVLAGQTWSLITPGRTGISPLPKDVFYTLNMDTNYQAGLVWGRIPELRVAYHPMHELAAALALDNPEQYIGGSSGGGLITLPSSLSAMAGTQLDNGASTLSVPNLVPDVIAKVATDPVSQVHVEIGGVERQFKVYNTVDNTKHSATGLGGFLNFNLELFEGFHLLSNNFYGAGGGRYIYGQAPDLIVQSDGSIKTVQSGSTVSGLEYGYGGTQLFGYYGAVYIRQTDAPATAGGVCSSASSCVGYGYAGAPAAQNKMIQEATIGINQDFWRDPKYGALVIIGQYSYLQRNPWSYVTGSPSNAHLNMFFLDLRYVLPGTPPRT